VLAITGGLLILERLVVTQTEEVEDALDRVAQALVAGDSQTVLAALSPQCPKRGEIQSVLSRFTISSARIGGDLEIRFNDLSSPPTATAYFTGIVDAKDNRGAIPYEHMIRKFKVTLRKEGDRWLIHDYTDAEPRKSRVP
jgi:ketosteroid isomerase-like protein